MAKMTPADVRAAAAKRHYEPKILDNADRGDIAEEIIAGILEPGWRYCGGAWASWDFEHSDGTRLQVKQSAARQTWTRKKDRRPIFSIKPQKGHWENGTDWIEAPTPTRFAHIYVFAWHGETDETCDQADPAQWLFYVIPTTELLDKNSISLTELKRGLVFDQDTLAAGVEVARRSIHHGN